MTEFMSGAPLLRAVGVSLRSRRRWQGRVAACTVLAVPVVTVIQREKALIGVMWLHLDLSPGFA